MRSVIDQASLALEKKFLDADNCARRLDKVFLICSGKISVDARAILNDWLEGHSRVSLVDGNKLVSLLIQHRLVHLLDIESRPSVVEILPCRLDTYAKKIASWEQLLRHIVHGGLSVSNDLAEEIYEGVLERERILETIVGEGFALPHVSDTRLDCHKILLCTSNETYNWTLRRPEPVRCVVLCLYMNEQKEMSTIRRAVAAVVGESIANKWHNSLGEAAWLQKTQACLADSLAQKDFEVKTFPMRKVSLGSHRSMKGRNT